MEATDRTDLPEDDVQEDPNSGNQFQVLFERWFNFKVNIILIHLCRFMKSFKIFKYIKI
jgi:hypothetical protein